jgi:acyl-CoA dehydrogenase
MTHELDSLLRLPFFTPAHHELARKVAAWRNDFEGDDHGETDLFATCRTLVEALGDAGLLSLAVPLDGADGGGKHDVRSLCLTRQLLAYRSGLLDFVFALQGLGSGAIVLFGTPEQRARYLPAARRGEAIAAFALSEARSGSDVANIETTAHRDGEEYVINGEKTWISKA